MKKMFATLVSLVTIASVSAQQSDRYYPRQSDDNSITYHDRNDDGPDYGRSSRTVEYDHRGRENNRDYNTRQKQEEMNRINHDYDRRINGYKKDRSFSRYERNRRIRQAEEERNGKLRSFGGGVLLGGILGVILGTQL